MSKELIDGFNKISILFLIAIFTGGLNFLAHYAEVKWLTLLTFGIAATAITLGVMLVWINFFLGIYKIFKKYFTQE